MERERVKIYYKPTELLADEQAENRRERNRKNAKKFYYKHKKNRDGNCEMPTVSEAPTSKNSPNIGNRAMTNEEDDNGVRSTISEDVLTVKMPFYKQMPGPSNRGTKKKRQSRALKRTYKRIETLEDQNETLKRKLKTPQKRIERFEQSKGKKATTPRSKTDSLLKCCGIHPEQATENNTIAETPNEIRKLKSIIIGKVVKKYRLRKYLQDMTALGRRKLINNKRTNTKIMRSRAEKVKRDVYAFLMRGDNSRVMPGKGDTVTVGREKKTKRILNDYMQNLHLKFIAENEYRISKASFCRHRPKELTLVN
ncbi:hypothetical protein MAR_018550 [Mya arenaria]|uniref:Uncharacterized protein n=1 Tax=Mya arenaria TaxID=6604 RepID=A0ABY7EI65_MYAAR|nr:hypothetical protein MAR_018550 [Mya arenaria]